MKILMLNYEYPPLGGGASKVSRDLSEKLVEKGHEIDVITMSYKEKKGKTVENGVTVYRIPSFRSKIEVCHPYEMLSYLISGLNFATELTKEKNYDINHTHFLIPTGLISHLLKKITGLPYIVTIHGSDIPGYNPDRFKIWHKFTKPMIRTVGKNASRIVSPSNYLKGLLTENVDIEKNKIKVIPNGFDIEKYTPAEKEDRILLVSRLLKRKGFQYFLRAIRDMDLNGYRASIVGEGPYKKELEEIAGDDHRVKFHGWVSEEELKDLYEKSKIFVFPSTMENFPTVLLEAMSAGMAIITSNVSGCPELIGDSGFKLKPDEISELRKNLRKLIFSDELIKKMSKNSRNRVKDKYQWNVVVEKYTSLYAKIAQTHEPI